MQNSLRKKKKQQEKKYQEKKAPAKAIVSLKHQANSNAKAAHGKRKHFLILWLHDWTLEASTSKYNEIRSILNFICLQGKTGDFLFSLLVPSSASTRQQNTAVFPQALVFNIPRWRGMNEGTKGHRRGRTQLYPSNRPSSAGTRRSPILPLSHWANGQSK